MSVFVEMNPQLIDIVRVLIFLQIQLAKMINIQQGSGVNHITSNINADQV